MIFQDLIVDGWSKEMHHTFWYKNTISLSMTRSGHAGKEFVQELGITGCAFYSKDVRRHLC